jgi:hypothetical protein
MLIRPPQPSSFTSIAAVVPQGNRM